MGVEGVAVVIGLPNNQGVLRTGTSGTTDENGIVTVQGTAGGNPNAAGTKQDVTATVITGAPADDVSGKCTVTVTP